ncbi:serine/threonine protein kinase [Pedobacter sp. AW31-3R]|uniref:serine/threonine protein kinase n=1 Tax=Pedobacter sp. AW31-3R TaxID=3445781 RepID=UPI003F9EED8A
MNIQDIDNTWSEHGINVNRDDFTVMLDELGLSYEQDGQFALVGVEPSPTDHIIYISVIRPQIWDLLTVVLPQLCFFKLTFQIVMNSAVAEMVMSGFFGENNIGKVIIFFVPSNRDFEEITAKLIGLTEQYNGPVIPGERNLGGLLYLNVQQIGGEQGRLKANHNNWAIFKRKYMVTSTLKRDVKGDVLKALYLKKAIRPSLCIIKEGKKFMIADDNGRDIRDRLKWQYKIQKELYGLVDVPRVIDFFDDNGNTYFVMEFIEGSPLTIVINELYKERRWWELPLNEKAELFDLFFDVIDILEKLHQKGYVHRDLSPLNFLRNKRGQLYVIDFELTYHVDSRYPLPPFGMGTKGFMPPEQYAFDVPTVKEDIFGLGALMLGFFGNLPAAMYDFHQSDIIAKDLFSSVRNLVVTELITSCLNIIPQHRPDLQEIRGLMLSWREEYI